MTIRKSLIKYVILLITICVPLTSLVPLSAAAQVLVPAALTQQRLRVGGGH